MICPYYDWLEEPIQVMNVPPGIHVEAGGIV
jgi:hypothetical protein